MDIVSEIKNNNEITDLIESRFGKGADWFSYIVNDFEATTYIFVIKGIFRFDYEGRNSSDSVNEFLSFLKIKLESK